eukprot:gene11495-13362_t
MVDMRWGVRDENTSDHMTWIACSRALEWCKRESSDVYFFSLQADKYGYTPLPKFLTQVALDERLLSIAGADTADPSTIEALRHWYFLDMNAVPPHYVLRTLTDANSKQYWSALPHMVGALSGMCFEDEAFPGLLKVGHSVTEWEVLSAFQKQLQARSRHTNSYAAEIPTIDRNLETSFLWSRRHFAAPPTAEVDPKKLFNDGRDNDVVAAQLNALKTYMEGLFPSSCVTDHAVSAGEQAGLTLPAYNSLDTADTADPSAQQYLHSFRSFAKNRLMCSLERVIALKQRWAEDGCGMGILGASLAEMLHHCEWAQTKCLAFQGREGLVMSALEMVQRAPQTEDAADHHLRGISMCVIGVSGAGKTSLMAKMADCVFLSHQSTASPVPVIVRFCGTSAGSRNARSLICSISEQLELLMGLEQNAGKLFESNSYAEQVSYFQQLVHEHPVVLFIDSLDQLSDEDQGRSRISFLWGIIPHPQSRIVVSCLPDEYDAVKQEWKYCYQCETRLREANVPKIAVSLSGEASNSEAMELMQSMLLQQYSRTLTATQFEDVWKKVAVEPTALYLSLAMRVVQHWTSDLQSQDSQLLLQSGVRSLIEQIFATLERDFGSVLTKAALGFITYAVNGASDVEIEDLLSMHDAVLDSVFQYATPKVRRLPSHVWLRLKQALTGLVVEGEQGCTTWYHRQLKETAEIYFAPEKQHLHAIMAKYFGKLVDDSMQCRRKLGVQEWTICGQSPFYMPSVVNKRRCVEGTHHMIAAEMISEAEEQLCSFECICSMIRAGQAFRLVTQLLELTTLIHTSYNLHDLLADHLILQL